MAWLRSSISFLRIQLLGLAAEDVLGDEEYVGGTLCQTPHEVRIPLGSKGHIDSHAPSIAHQTLLQVAANAVQHLEFEGIAGDSFPGGKLFGLIDDVFIVCSQAMIGPALHENFH